MTPDEIRRRAIAAIVKWAEGSSPSPSPSPKQLRLPLEAQPRNDTKRSERTDP